MKTSFPQSSFPKAAKGQQGGNHTILSLKTFTCVGLTTIAILVWLSSSPSKDTGISYQHINKQSINHITSVSQQHPNNKEHSTQQFEQTQKTTYFIMGLEGSGHHMMTSVLQELAEAIPDYFSLTGGPNPQD